MISPSLPTLHSETLPWGQVVTFHPIDYRRLGEELCECVLDSLEGQIGTHQPPQHYVRAEGTQFVLHGRPLRFSGFNAAQVGGCSESVGTGVLGGWSNCSAGRYACAGWQRCNAAPCGAWVIPDQHARHQWQQSIWTCAPPACPQALPWAASGDPRLLEDLERLFADAAGLGLKVQ